MRRNIIKAFLVAGTFAAGASAVAAPVMVGWPPPGEPNSNHAWCAQLTRLNGSYHRITEQTREQCEAAVFSMTEPPNPNTYTSIVACHECRYLFRPYTGSDLGAVPSGLVELAPDSVQMFLDGLKALRSRYRIDEYEAAQNELARSLQPK